MQSDNPLAVANISEKNTSGFMGGGVYTPPIWKVLLNLKI